MFTQQFIISAIRASSFVESFHRVDRIEMANFAKKRLGSVSFDLLPQRCVLSASPTFIKIENIMQ